MIFSKKNTRDLKMNIVTDGQEIDEVKKTKFLGVIIDSKLNWKEHISYISGKLSRSIGMILKARHFLNNHGLIALYFSLLYPYLSYCKPIWGSTYKTNLIIKSVNIDKYLIGRFMFRVYQWQVPKFFSPFFVKNCDIHQHESRLAGPQINEHWTISDICDRCAILLFICMMKRHVSVFAVWMLLWLVSFSYIYMNVQSAMWLSTIVHCIDII